LDFTQEAGGTPAAPRNFAVTVKREEQ